MPSFCVVSNCNDKYGHAENISFHKFPFKRQALLQKWLDFAQRGTEWQPSRWSAICSRHFREEDFNGAAERKTLKKTAVPSIRPAEGETPSKEKTVAVTLAPVDHEGSDEEPQPHRQIFIAPTHCSPNAPKIKCRLCGHATPSVVSFSTNFEIYGMIQKCFPTLNIQKDDHLPKEMCRICLKRLENFSRFIDKVLETQSELQRNFRNEKSSSNASKLAERPLKVKQEPVVRVKQEVAEGFDSFLSDDMDMGIDESCEQEQESTVVDQKYDFCDFPMLNSQDIINNCDIMEIINLDDPFINIPDDDANTNCDSGENQQLPLSKRPLPSAHELLQAHLLIEEHNYAYAAEDLKEEWQIKNTYKTEKTEEYEQEDMLDEAAAGDNDDELPNYGGTEENQGNEQGANTQRIEQGQVINNIQTDCAESRATHPIVTSVSAYADSPLTPDTRLVTAVKDIPSTEALTKAHTKPNIVVLNESIVKSSTAFQLHACTCCQLKFFSLESLSQHYANMHNQLPMVSVPSTNLWDAASGGGCGSMEAEVGSCKQEKESEKSAPHTNPIQWNLGTYDNGPKHMEIPDAKNQIKILEMQQSFVRQLEHFNGIYNQQANDQGPMTMTPKKQMPSMGEHKTDNLEQPQGHLQFSSNGEKLLLHNALNKPLEKASHHSRLKPVKALKTPAQSPVKSPKHYHQLRQRYRQLQRRYRNLQARAGICRKSPPKTLHCRRCHKHFSSIYALLRHQRVRSHHIRKPASRFAATCCGCEKFFRSKLALHNHMRYICQSLPLRWLKQQMQTFKCRHCRRYTFNHWRLYRRHERRCLQRKSGRMKRKKDLKKSKKIHPKLQKLQSRNKCQKQQRQTNHQHSTARQYVCALCSKVFANANCLNQHSITHSSQRTHKCGLCERVFKRRNGLTQHMKGFHLQLKPFECAVCGHRYALKCDMLRCRHSLRRLGGVHLEVGQTQQQHVVRQAA